MARNLGQCAAASIALALAAVTCSAHADVKPGDRITPENVAAVKDLISPGLEWCIRHGWPLTVTETKRVEWPKAYREAQSGRHRSATVDNGEQRPHLGTRRQPTRVPRSS